MLVRLWWKEARVFGPAALVLLVAAALLQWFFLSSGAEGFRNGSMIYNLLSFGVLYAFAVAAASFSGERESNTLGFLDALPVGRSMLWLGKASFAIGSTTVFILMLSGLSELALTDASRSIEYSWRSIFITLAPILMGGLVWGLFWSALSKNTLIAAVLAVASVGATLLPTADARYRWVNQGSVTWQSDDFLNFAFTALIMLLAGVGSLVILAWRPSRTWTLVRTGQARTERPMTIRKASLGRSLSWQVIREALPMALIVIPLALFIPVFNWIFQERMDGVLDVFLATLASLVAGVSVFGSENAIGSRRFLVHHGVKAGSVWWRRLSAWGLLIGLILGFISYAILHSPGSLVMPGFTSRPDRVYVLTISSVNAFLIGTLCGMMVRRRITAALLSAMLWFVMVLPQFGLRSFEMIPSWSLVLVPLILLGISAGWARDWLLDPEGLRRWLRLTVLVVVPFSGLFCGFTAYRAFGVTDVGPVYGQIPMTALPTDQNAATIYRKAGELFRVNPGFAMASKMIENGWNDDQTFTSELLSMNQPALDLAKLASKLSQFQPRPIERMTSTDEDWDLFYNLQKLNQLLAIEMRKKQANGDLSGAWDNLLTIFRMTNQIVETNPTISWSQTANVMHHQAIGLAFEWLADPRQDLATVRKALADLKSLPELPDLSQALRFQSYLDEKLFDLPGDELAQALYLQGERKRPDPFQFMLVSRFVCAPWERMRARRICRQVFSECIAAASVEPYQRTTRVLDQYYDRNDSMLIPSFVNSIPQLSQNHDREILSQRALLQAVALVVWKLEHDGKDAAKLADLVPGLLDRLPVDPYSGRNFHTIKSEGRLKVWRPLDMNKNQDWLLKPTRMDQLLLYSVGPDLVKKRVQILETPDRAIIPIPLDFLYAIP